MKIILRPVTLKDSPLIVKWRNSPKVKEHCFTKKSISKESNAEFFTNNIESGRYKQYIVECIEENFGLSSYPIATVYLKDIDKENKRCELCVFTSDDVEWDSEGQASAIRLLVEKAFNEFGMHKIYSYVFYKFLNEVDLLKNAGFSVEAILKDEAANENGEYEDVLRMTIFKDTNK